MSRLGNIGGRLYRGEVSFDFVGRKKLWYTISGAILVISVAALLHLRGLNFSVDFKGGDIYKFTTPRRRAPDPDAGRRARRSTPARPPSTSCSRSATRGWSVQTPVLGNTTRSSASLHALAKLAAIVSNNGQPRSRSGRAGAGRSRRRRSRR